MATNILIPMAGRGSRFVKENFDLPKPLITINDIPMIAWAIKSLRIDGNYHFVVRRNEHLDHTIKILNDFCENPIIIDIDYVTEGAASSALLLKDYINTDEELIMANCDQIMNWDGHDALEELRKYDGAVVTMNLEDPKYSYIKLDEQGYATELAEKVVISNHALTGIHYWKKGKYFVKSAEEMISNNDRTNGEFYVAPTYNYLIRDGLKIGAYEITNKQFYAVGTPSDLQRYLNEK